MASLFERIAESILGKALREGLNAMLKRERKPSFDTVPIEKNPPSNQPKSHPWRLCPLGEHWVKTHPLNVPASSKGPEWLTIRHGHCHTTPSGKELCTADELKEIARTCFEPLRDDASAMPIPDDLDLPNGNKYDLSIAGWTKFWNETLNQDNPVTSDFVKALLSTETDFKVLPDTSSNAGAARGLFQITESTRKILQNSNGELKNYLISMTVEESRDAEISISAGVRWLYHKRNLLRKRLKREVSWEEVGAEYKGIYPDLERDETTDEIMRRLRYRHKRLRDKRDGARK